MIILPRQARDEHRENSQKDAFLQVGRWADCPGPARPWPEVSKPHDCAVAPADVHRTQLGHAVRILPYS
jgi:hypothetical protein